MKRRSSRMHARLLSLRALCAACLCAALPGVAQYSPLATVKQVPADVTPRVQLAQCGGFGGGHFGPLDFRSIDPRDRRVVEKYHFDQELQTFLSGRDSGRNAAGTGSILGGFVYTLKAIPNHVPALVVMEQFARRHNSETPHGSDIPMECWYVRAFMIAPDDAAVRALYGTYLAHRNRKTEAMLHLELSEAETRASAGLQHQIGLAYVALKEWRRAQLVAMRLARMGFALDAVARQVTAANQWDALLKLEDVAPADAGAAPAPGG